jgi:hypothetical protein
MAFGFAGSADAADFTVDRIDDPAGVGACVLATPSDCSIRQAIAAAQNGNRPVVDRILFQSGLSGTTTLMFGLTVTEPLEIAGPGAGALTLSGGDGQRILFIEQGTAGDPVTISGLELTDAYGSGSVGGAAIYAKDTDLEVHDSTISSSTAGAAEYFGGGIRQINGSLLVENSTISGNEGGNGGGIHAANADVGIRNSTISGNTATGAGGGSGYGYGGGIWLDDGPADAGSLIVYGSTISGNHAYDGGGLTAAVGTNGIASTVVANNTATAATPQRDLRSAGPGPFRLAFSLVESPDGASIVDITTFAGSNVLGVDPQLGPLAANGGPTLTHRPSLASPLLDKGFTQGLLTDQRGLPRTFDNPSLANATGGGGVDIGAVELQGSEFPSAGPPATPAAPGAPATPAPAAKCKKAKKKKGKGAASAAKCKKKKKKKKK